MADVPKESEKKIQQLQMIEQSLKSLSMKMQQIELNSAIKELENVEEAYKIVGNIMVLSKKEDLVKDLQSKKETVDLRIQTMEKQEEQFKEKANKIQGEVLSEMKEE